MRRVMPKLELKEWAALGEVIGTVAVVISLVFVIVSVKQNTDALQGLNDNALFEQHIELMNLIVADPSMAAIYAKKAGGNEALTDIETVRWQRYQTNLLDIWVMAYTRHQTGLLADEHWEPWDNYFTELFSLGAERMSREQWQQLRFGFETEFWDHVDNALFGADSKDHDPPDR